MKGGGREGGRNAKEGVDPRSKGRAHQLIVTLLGARKEVSSRREGGTEGGTEGRERGRREGGEGGKEGKHSVNEQRTVHCVRHFWGVLLSHPSLPPFPPTLPSPPALPPSLGPLSDLACLFPCTYLLSFNESMHYSTSYYLFIYLINQLFIYLFIYLINQLFIYLFIYLFIHLINYLLLIYLFI